MNLLEELKSVDTKDPGSWPWLVKIVAFIAIFIGVIALGAIADSQRQWSNLQDLKKQEATLKDTLLTKKREAINFDIIKKQLIETKLSFSALLKQLPTKSEMDSLLTDINQAGLGRGLQFDLFRPGLEIVTGSFTEQPISIKVSGNYDDLGKFCSDISQLPRIVTLNDISISPVAGGGLSMDATAKTYRYLDEAELAAQKTAKPGGVKK